MTEQQRARLEIMADPESPRHGLRPSDCEAIRAALDELNQVWRERDEAINARRSLEEKLKVPNYAPW